MRTAITGGTGFIGSYVVRWALQNHVDLVLVNRGDSHCKDLEGAFPKASIQHVSGGLRNANLSKELRGCEMMIHLAACGVTRPESWEQCFQTNLLDSLHAWNEALWAGVKRFAIIGSCFEYGSSAEKYERVPTTAPLAPVGAYAASKAAATLAAQAFAIENDVELMVVRLFHVYGEGELESRFWPSLCKAAQSGSDFPMTEGEQVRDFCPAIEAASGIWRLALHRRLLPGKPQIVNFGTGVSRTLADFARLWWSRFNARGNLILGAIPYRKNEIMRLVPELDF